MADIKLITKGSDTVRIKWVDRAKGIGIVLVVIGHILGDQHVLSLLYQLIYAFHMPLFFVISGYLQSSNAVRYRLYDSFINNSRQLLLPYYFFGFLSFFILVISAYGDGTELDWHDTFKSTFQLLAGLDARFYSKSVNARLINAPLWFFPALFMTRMIYFVLIKLFPVGYLLLSSVILSAIGHLYIYSSMPPIPMQFDAALIAIFFYVVGVFCRKHDIFSDDGLIGNNAFIISVSVFVVYLWSACANGNVALRGPYGYLPLFYLSAITGSLLVIIISRYIRSSLLSFFGVMSALIFPIHDFIERYTHIPKVYGLIDWYSAKLSHIFPSFDVKYAYLGYQLAFELFFSCLLGVLLIRVWPGIIGGKRVRSPNE